MSGSGPLGVALVCGGNPDAWNWRERAHDEEHMNGVEAWVFALRGSYKSGADLTPSDLDANDIIILNLNFGTLPYLLRVLQENGSRRAKVVGLYEGDLAQLHLQWKIWGAVADRCDLIISINRHGTSTLQALTSAPVHYIGIPYPVEGIERYRTPIDERRREILLCSPLLKSPLDYLAARDLGVPMYAYEETFSRNVRGVARHRSFDKLRYVRRAITIYHDSNLTIHPMTNLAGFFERTRTTYIWMDLDPRYTWARYVLDGAALGIPVITTPTTGHGPLLFPELVVESPYDIDSARRIARRLLDDPEHYQRTVEHATGGLDWYRAERAVERLGGILNDGF